VTATSWLAWTALILALGGLAGGALVWLQDRRRAELVRQMQQRQESLEQGLLTLGQRLIQLERRLNDLADRQVLQRALEHSAPGSGDRAEQARRLHTATGQGSKADSEAELRLRALLAARGEAGER